MVLIVSANCYRYNDCSALVPFSGPGNFSTDIFCNNLQNYCQCMNYFYPVQVNGVFNFDTINTCVVLCKRANCDDWNIDCDLIYKNSGSKIIENFMLLVPIILFLI